MAFKARSQAIIANCYDTALDDVVEQYIPEIFFTTAAAHRMKVVTFETSDPKCKKRVKIPDACLALGVEYCSLNDLLHELGVIV